MKLESPTLPLIAASLALLLGCSTNGEAPEREDSHGEMERGGEHEGRGEHDRDSSEHGSEAGEESGVELGLDEQYDAVRNGVRLFLAYDSSSNTFRGMVENTTERTLESVRVEVHLSNGRELGPTTPADLAPGEKREISLAAVSTDFERWTAHPEVGRGEHESEGEGEHGGGGEHQGEGGEHG